MKSRSLLGLLFIAFLSACTKATPTLNFGLSSLNSGPLTISQEIVPSSVMAGSEFDFNLNVSNPSSQSISITAISFDQSYFKLKSSGCATLVAGASCAMTLTFYSEGEGTHTGKATLSLADSLGVSSSQSVDLSASGTFQTASVTALYPSNGSKWNDYVNNDGSNFYNATDTLCSAPNAAYPNVCIHGGEKRKVALSSTTGGCSGFTVVETLAVFNWTCQVLGTTPTIVSMGLKPGKGLRDLISGTSFRSNDVKIYKNSKLFAQTNPATWWTNTIANLPTSGTLGTASIIYVASGLTALSGLNIAANKVAIVTERPNGILRWDNSVGTNNCDTSTGGILPTPNAHCLIHSSSAIHIWIEADMNGDGHSGTTNNADTTLLFYNLKFSRLINSRIRNSGGTTPGVGFYMAGAYSNGNLIENSSFGYHNMGGIKLIGGSTHNIFSNLSFDTNNAGGGASAFDVVSTADYNVFTRILTVGNNTTGLNIAGKSVLSHLTSANNLSYGVTLATDVISANHIVSVNNGGNGLYLSVASNSRLSEVVLASNNSLQINQASPPANLLYHGRLMVSGNCYSSTANIGINGVANSCAKAGFSYGPLLDTSTYIDATTFFGKVIVDDASNSADNSGSQAYGSITDWFNFENPFRLWGMDGSAFPATDHKGACTTGTCRIWDWSIGTSSPLKNINGTLTDGAACPASVSGATADVSLQATGGTAYYLSHAVEIIGDSVGNENGLCESNESCIFSPHIGAYLGHGELNKKCTFSNTPSISGVTMYGYEYTTR